MLNSQTNPDSIQEMSTPDTMTLEEFLENDLEGYEYVKGELVPMSPPSMEHGEIVLILFTVYIHTSVRTS